MHLSPQLEVSLVTWLPKQRWFAGKGRPITRVAVSASTELSAALHHVILAVHQGGQVTYYQLLLGSRGSPSLGSAVGSAAIGDGWFDAVYDPSLVQVLLTHLAAGSEIGSLRFRTASGVRLDTSPLARVSPSEQSNTSLIFGTQYICKLFRRLTPGVNPDLEINRRLSRLGHPYIPRLYGWIEADGPLLGPLPDGTTLGMVSEFLPSSADGWQLATTSEFTGETGRLGALTAVLHRDLAAAFGVTSLTVEGLRASARLMQTQLATAREAVPELAPYASLIKAAFDDLAKRDVPLPVQRIHGDFHLGQVLRTPAGWVILDFEGEPARTPAERRAPSHPLRDVAGMLRSLEYAATAHTPSREWADQHRAAFCRGYAQAGGPDPATQEVLFRAFEFDKAVYEVLYEARNRPTWLHVPLGSLAHLVS